MRAYDLRPEPIILFNVAQTYRLEFSSEQALVYYKRFLAESKIAEDLRDEAQTYVAEIEAEQRAREEQKKLDATTGPRERDGTPVKVTAPPMDRPSPGRSVRPPGDTEGDPEDAATRGSGAVWSTKRKVALGVATGGALALVAGTVLGVSAKTKQSDAHALCSDPQVACDSSRQANDLVHSGHTLAIDANVAFGVGAAAAIAAGVLWFTGAPESHHAVTVVPSAASGQILVTAHGSF
ncbi:MAG: hypothetical protein E6J90_41555 [Deltaproteobacteria bacterium]|nr:MAG: hypothetical protein E6J90_41555 [Deltaproteobacteria bacterium]